MHRHPTQIRGCVLVPRTQLKIETVQEQLKTI